MCVPDEYTVMTGGRTEVVDDKEILEVFVKSEDPVLFTTEIADVIGFSNPGTMSRLRELENDSLLMSKTGGGKVPVWWITEKGKEYLEGCN